MSTNREHHPMDPVERFEAWRMAVSDWCEIACGYTAENVEFGMLRHYYRQNMTSQEAGALLAKLIS